MSLRFKAALVTSLGSYLLGSLAIASTNSSTKTEVAKFRYTPSQILCAVAKKMNVVLRSDIPVPPVFLQSETPLSQFQDAIEPQWGFRPDGFLNAYIANLNQIYLLDEAKYYRETGRAIDDSLAHELTHFIQVKYRNIDLNMEEWAEAEAVDVQTWFRANFIAQKPSPENDPMITCSVH